MELMECPICKNEWNSEIYVPIILQCGHTFCKKCIKDYISIHSKINCFMCRQMFNIRNEKEINRLPINFILFSSKNKKYSEEVQNKIKKPGVKFKLKNSEGSDDYNYFHKNLKNNGSQEKIKLAIDNSKKNRKFVLVLIIVDIIIFILLISLFIVFANQNKNKNNDSFLDMVYPIGSIYLSFNEDLPSKLFGGEWNLVAPGQVLVGINKHDPDFNTVRLVGGSKTAKLIKHSHDVGSYNVYATFGYYQEDYSKKQKGYSGGGYMKYHYIGDTDKGLSEGDCVQPGLNAYSGNGFKGNSGVSGNIESQNNNNLQPYLTCYIWERIK